MLNVKNGKKLFTFIIKDSLYPVKNDFVRVGSRYIVYKDKRSLKYLDWTTQQPTTIEHATNAIEYTYTIPEIHLKNGTLHISGLSQGEKNELHLKALDLKGRIIMNTAKMVKNGDHFMLPFDKNALSNQLIIINVEMGNQRYSWKVLK